MDIHGTYLFLVTYIPKGTQAAIPFIIVPGSFSLYSSMLGKLKVAPNSTPLNREYKGNIDTPNAPFIAPSVHH